MLSRIVISSSPAQFFPITFLPSLVADIILLWHRCSVVLRWTQTCWRYQSITGTRFPIAAGKTAAGTVSTDTDLLVISIAADWAKHEREQIYDVGSAREHISPLLNWDTSFNVCIYIYRRPQRRVWNFDPFLIINCSVKQEIRMGFSN